MAVKFKDRYELAEGIPDSKKENTIMMVEKDLTTVNTLEIPEDLLVGEKCPRYRLVLEKVKGKKKK